MTNACQIIIDNYHTEENYFLVRNIPEDTMYVILLIILIYAQLSRLPTIPRIPTKCERS